MRLSGPCVKKGSRSIRLGPFIQQHMEAILVEWEAFAKTLYPATSKMTPLAQPIEASLSKPDLNAPTSVSISASVIGVENTHAPELMMLQPSL
jgi:hypothetical protein